MGFYDWQSLKQVRQTGWEMLRSSSSCSAQTKGQGCLSMSPLIFISWCTPLLCCVSAIEAQYSSQCSYTATTVMEAVLVCATKILLLLWKCQSLPSIVKQQKGWFLTNYNSIDNRAHTQTSLPHALCSIDEGINALQWDKAFIWGSQSILRSGNMKWHYLNCIVRWAGLQPSLIACWNSSLAFSWGRIRSMNKGGFA